MVRKKIVVRVLIFLAVAGLGCLVFPFSTLSLVLPLLAFWILAFAAFEVEIKLKWISICGRIAERIRIRRRPVLQTLALLEAN